MTVVKFDLSNISTKKYMMNAKIEEKQMKEMITLKRVL